MSRVHDVFISYAWRKKGGDPQVDALVLTLRRDHGLEVFQDKDCLVEGDLFEQLGRAIEGSRVFVPCLSKVYVEKVGGKSTKGKKDDSCRSEFRIARQHHGDVTSFPVVLEENVKDPKTWGPRILHLLGDKMFVDFTDESSVEQTARKIAEFVRHVTATPRTQLLFTQVRTEDNLLLIKKKASEYTAGTRLWIIKEIASWDRTRGPGQVFVVLGPAGIGKSVFAAAFCKTGKLFEPDAVFDMLEESIGKKPSSRRSSLLGRLFSQAEERFSWLKLFEAQNILVIAAHAFKHDSAFASSLSMCLISLAKQMCRSVPGFVEVLQPRLMTIEISSLGLMDLFRELISVPLQIIEDKGQSPTVTAAVFVDAIDECRASDRRALLEVMQSFEEEVPKWVVFLTTGRPHDIVVSKTRQFNPRVLFTDGEKNLEDMRVFFKDKLADRVEAKDLEAAIAILLERSEGLPLYGRLFDFALSKVKRKILSIQDIRDSDLFPPGLERFYEQFFSRFLDEALNGDTELYQRLLGPMCVAREPIPVEVLREILGFEKENDKNFTAILRAVQLLLVVSDATFRFAHKSMAEFLPNPERNTIPNLCVDEERGADELALFCKRNVVTSAYAARNAVFQCSLAEDFHAISEILCDFEQLFAIIVTHQVPARNLVKDCEERFTDLWKSDSDAQLVVRALEKALNGLGHDPRELPGQLMGRLPARHPVAVSAGEFDFKFRFVKPAQNFAGRMIQADSPVRKILYGHNARIRGLSLDDSVVASSSEDGTVKIWSIKTGEAIHTLRGHLGRVMCVKLGRDIVATGGSDKTIRIWKTNTGELLKALTGHTGFVYSVDLHDDFLVSGSGDGTMKTWDLRAETLLSSFDITGKVSTMMKEVRTVSLDLEVIATGSADGFVNVFDRTTSKCRFRHNADSLGVDAVLVTENYVACGGSDGRIQLLSKTQGSPLHVLKHGARISCLALVEGLLCSCGSDGKLKIWDSKSGSLEGILHGHGTGLFAVDAYEKKIVSGGNDGALILWSLNEMTRTPNEGHNAFVNCIATNDEFVVTGSGDGSLEAVTWDFSDDTTVKVWSMSAGELLHSFDGAKDRIMKVAISGSKVIFMAELSSLVGNSNEFAELSIQTLSRRDLDVSSGQQALSKPQPRSNFAFKLAERSLLKNAPRSQHIAYELDPTVVGLTLDAWIESAGSLPENGDVLFCVDGFNRRPIRFELSSAK